MKINFFNMYIDFLLLFKNKYKKMKKLPVNNINHIVIYSNTAIGDTLFNTPSIRALKLKYPNKKITILLNPVNYKLFENNPYIDNIILYNGKWRTFFSILKKLKTIGSIDLTLILHSNEPQATPLAVLSDSKYILKIPNNKTKYSKFHNNSIIFPYNNKHGIFDRLKSLEFLDIKSKDIKMDLIINNDSLNEVIKYFKTVEINNKKDVLIGFQIGASTVSRMWFENKWTELGNNLLKKYDNVKIILTGSPSEKELTTRVYNNINDKKRVFNLAGYFSLQSAAALISKLDILVTPDTGPMHMAIALKVPTVGLFVVAELIKSHACYDKDIHLFIKKPLTCTPCIAKKCKFQKCMEQITVNEVIEKIVKILENRGDV